MPRNGLDQIRRVLLRFKLDPGLYLTITPHTNAEHPSAGQRAGSAPRRPGQPGRAAGHCNAGAARHAGRHTPRMLPSGRALLALAGDDDASQDRYREEVFVPRKSVLDLLDEYPSCAPPFETFLDLLPPLRPRYYSISSSPLAAADACSITVGVVEAPARSGHGAFKGICSNYLAATTGRRDASTASSASPPFRSIRRITRTRR